MQYIYNVYAVMAEASTLNGLKKSCHRMRYTMLHPVHVYMQYTEWCICGGAWRSAQWEHLLQQTTSNTWQRLMTLPAYLEVLLQYLLYCSRRPQASSRNGGDPEAAWWKKVQPLHCNNTHKLSPTYTWAAGALFLATSSIGFPCLHV